MMCDVCVFVCFVVSGVAPARIQRICLNIYNLGINITLSRKLLTSKPDTKIGRTIVINSRQRSIVLELAEPRTRTGIPRTNASSRTGPNKSPY
jgi:hypothetical protein